MSIKRPLNQEIRMCYKSQGVKTTQQFKKKHEIISGYYIAPGQIPSVQVIKGEQKCKCKHCTCGTNKKCDCK